MSTTPSNKPYHGLIQPPPGQPRPDSITTLAMTTINAQPYQAVAQGSKVVIHQLPVTAIDSKREANSLMQPSTQTNIPADAAPPNPEAAPEALKVAPRYVILNEPQIALAHLQLKPRKKILRAQHKRHNTALGTQGSEG